jgi:hypothetical protein
MSRTIAICLLLCLLCGCAILPHATLAPTSGSPATEIPVPPPADSATPTKTQLPTNTSLPTTTPTQETTATPDASPTPAVREYRHGLATTNAEFTLLTTDEEEAAVTRDVIKNGTGLDLNVEPAMRFTTKPSQDGYWFFDTFCRPGKNCAFGASIAREETMADGTTAIVRKLIMQGVIEQNGVRKIVTFKINCANFRLGTEGEIHEQRWYELMSKANLLGMRLVFDYGDWTKNLSLNPVSRWVVDHEDPEIVASLKQGIIPENLADTTLKMEGVYTSR